MVKKLFSAIAAFALLFTSCEMLTGEQVGKFHITSDTTVEIAADGNCIVASYVIDEAVDGAKVTATSTVDWAYDVMVNEEACTITFCVKKNEGEARTGSINVAYAGATATITINQEAALASKIEITSINPVEVVAEGACQTFSFAINEVVEGAVVEAVSADEWVYDVAVSTEDCRGNFCVKPNEGEARTTTVTLSYAGDTATVTINQLAASAE